MSVLIQLKWSHLQKWNRNGTLQEVLERWLIMVAHNYYIKDLSSLDYLGINLEREKMFVEKVSYEK